MDKEQILNDFFELSGNLVFVINIETKQVDILDKDETKLSYADFPKYIANKFNLILNFERRFIKFLEALNPADTSNKINIEYTGVDGLHKKFLYSIYKQNDKEFLATLTVLPDSSSFALDELTRAHKKKYIENIALQNLASKSPFALAIIDIDYFKRLNDTLGHMLGDVVLIEFVAGCQSIIGNNGSIARIGGDQFLLIVNIEDDYDMAHSLFRKIKESMYKISDTTAKGFKTSVTIGSAQYPSDGDTFDILLKKCEKALYRGKKKGRDCFVMYTEEKCGAISLDDLNVETNKIDKLTAKNNFYSVISGVNDLLANGDNFDESIMGALNLVGNYFYLDRLSIARLDIKTKTIAKHHVWHNPVNPIKYDVLCNDDVIPYWAEALGEKKFVRIDDSYSIGLDHPLHPIILKDHTTSSISIELIANDTDLGIIRYDMTTGGRRWQPEDYQMFNLLSNIFSSYIFSNYMKEINYQNLYVDSEYNCNNYSKFFNDSADYILKNKYPEYSVLDFSIRDFVKVRAIIGNKKMGDIIRAIVAVLKKHDDIIYGKRNDANFLVLFKHHNKDLIEALAKEIKAIVEIVKKVRRLSSVSISFGASFAYDVSDSLSDVCYDAQLTRLINKTDNILYYSDDIKSKSLFNSEIALRIDEAIRLNEFLLYLQPKISTKTGKIAGAEALTRWNYKHEKLLFPDQFIPVLEENGIIEKLDYGVFKNVCAFQRMLIDGGYTPVPISVNVSRYVSDFNEYINEIEKYRVAFDIDPSLIEIEITEGMYYENSNEIASFISDLHDIGYKVSMDDFGSGYSNFTSLVELNFDTIKLDKSFCTNLDSDKSKTMVFKLIEMVKALSMKTVCEGVETKENVDFLTSVGCDLIQGYYYDKPIPKDNFFEKYF